MTTSYHATATTIGDNGHESVTVHPECHDSLIAAQAAANSTRPNTTTRTITEWVDGERTHRYWTAAPGSTEWVERTLTADGAL